MDNQETKEIKIKKLVIKIGKTEVTVTPAQAKELYKALGEMFKENVIEYRFNAWWYHKYQPVVPYVTYSSGETGGKLLGNAIYCSTHNDSSRIAISAA